MLTFANVKTKTTCYNSNKGSKTTTYKKYKERIRL